MKKMILGLVLLASSTVYAGNFEARQELLQARMLIDSALRKLDNNEDIVVTRIVKNAQFICREKGTTDEVLQAIISAKKEVNARCDGRCEIIVTYLGENLDCKITARGIL